MTILVTGCAGFIGSSLSERLINDGHTVAGIDNFDDFYDRKLKEENLQTLLASRQFSFLEADIRDRSALDAIAPFEVVVHLAAKAGVRPSIAAPHHYIDANIHGTQNIVDLMRGRGVDKMVFASSSSVYGNGTVAPFSERANVDHPISPYAFTKKACELLLYSYFHLYRLSSVCLRFFTVYGPRQRPDLAINKFFRAVHDDQPITVFGDGNTSRDYTFIDDITSGIISAINHVVNNQPGYEIVNLGNSKPVRLLDLIQAIADTAGAKARLDFQPMQPGDVDMTCADISKAEALLGYHPQVTLAEGLRRFYAWKYPELVPKELS